MKTFIIKSIIIATAVVMVSDGKAQNRITLLPDPTGKKVDVLYDGRIFTSYIYPENLEKPVLYPIYTSKNMLITRGFPLDPRPNERIDHPHQVGLWFNFGDVNGLDFWNNSYAIPADQKSKYGSIKHREILEAKSGQKEGVLVTSSDWVDYAGIILLKDKTTYVFSGEGNRRIIRRTTVLTAQVPVVFTDNKEGLIGLRVDRAFEEPSNTPEIFLDAGGNPTEVPVMNNEGVNGVYRNSEGFQKGDVWGKPARWVCLSATKNGKDISIAIIDHKKNPGYPAHSHARGYGLFATNNMGSRVFDKDAPLFTLKLKPKQSVAFTHTIVIRDGSFLSDDEINAIK
jgi:hypothetical protein